jgi:hypothetical protein
MQTRSGVGSAVLAKRLPDLALRCRQLAEMTAVPEITREPRSIARMLEDEAELAEPA